MQRRDFIKSVIALGGASVLGQGTSFATPQISYAPTPQPDVKRVLIMFKCHFDAGFIATQATVKDWYFSDYFPAAIRRRQRPATDRRPSPMCGPRAPGWSTNIWSRPPPRIAAKWSKLSPQVTSRGMLSLSVGRPRLMDASMIAGSIGLSQSLDRRFGHTTTGAKMTDVPGHTRGLIAPLASQGVKFLDIGVNGGLHDRAEVPPIFLWKDSSGVSRSSSCITWVMAACLQVPGTDLAIVIAVRGDNSGPKCAQ